MRVPAFRLFAGAFISLALASAVAADEGRLEINHASALAGGITPGDAPGYPILISAAGHYVLTGPLSCPAPLDLYALAILINAANVTLDLNGFGIEITPGPGFGEAVRVSFPASNVTIRNGYIRATAATTRIAVFAVNVNDLKLEGLSVSGPAFDGISLSGGSRFHIIDNQVSNGGSHGILLDAGADGLVARNHMFGNGTFGLRSNPPAGTSLIRLEGNVFSANGAGTFIGANLFASGPNYCNGTAVCP